MLISPEPVKIKLLDLGIVTLVMESGVTEASIFLGSKHTASPEQFYGEEIDRRTDVYALGATLFHCYSGKQMYADCALPTAIVKNMIQNPVRCEVKAGDDAAGEKLVKFINECINIDKSERPSDANDCLETLNTISSQP